MSTTGTQRCYACGAELQGQTYWNQNAPSWRQNTFKMEGPFCFNCYFTKISKEIRQPVEIDTKALEKLQKEIEKYTVDPNNIYAPQEVWDQVARMKRINPTYKNKYNVLYLDPPWHYNDKAHAGKRGVEYKYQVMSDEDIAALPVGDLAKEDCCLFLWTTCPKLDVALSVISDWGFEYKTVAFMWVKTTKHGKLFWGMGNFSRANGELCLLATKGKPKRIAKNVHQIVMAQRREHSRKPDEVRDRIVALCGKNSKRLEMFARDPVDKSWDNWGNECKNSIDIFGEA